MQHDLMAKIPVFKGCLVILFTILVILCKSKNPYFACFTMEIDTTT